MVIAGGCPGGQCVSREFTAQVVELIRQGGLTFQDIGEQYDLSATTVASWLRADATAQAPLRCPRLPAWRRRRNDHDDYVDEQGVARASW